MMRGPAGGDEMASPVGTPFASPVDVDEAQVREALDALRIKLKGLLSTGSAWEQVAAVLRLRANSGAKFDSADSVAEQLLALPILQVAVVLELPTSTAISCELAGLLLANLRCLDGHRARVREIGAAQRAGVVEAAHPALAGAALAGGLGRSTDFAVATTAPGSQVSLAANGVLVRPGGCGFTILDSDRARAEQAIADLDATLNETNGARGRGGRGNVASVLTPFLLAHGDTARSTRRAMLTRVTVGLDKCDELASAVAGAPPHVVVNAVDYDSSEDARRAFRGLLDALNSLPELRGAPLWTLLAVIADEDVATAKAHERLGSALTDLRR
jgi:hypothetical protein